MDENSPAAHRLKQKAIEEAQRQARLPPFTPRVRVDHLDTPENKFTPEELDELMGRRPSYDE